MSEIHVFINFFDIFVHGKFGAKIYHLRRFRCFQFGRICGFFREILTKAPGTGETGPRPRSFPIQKYSHFVYKNAAWSR